MKQEIRDIGDYVMCDWCDREFNEPPASEEVGGLLFGSKAACPHCMERIEENAKKYGEQVFIRERANEGETFRDFCLRLRGGNNQIVTTSFENAGEMIDYMKERRKPENGED